MNSGPLLFLGLFLTFATSFAGLIIAPQLQLGEQEQTLLQSTGQLYPTPRPGLARAGAEVYRQQGCAECHTRQVRPAAYSGDIKRGWGIRRTVAADYLYDSPVLLGNLRVGPDLSNYGARQTDPKVILAHLYDSTKVTPGSMMPPYRFLFEEMPLRPGQKPSPYAIQAPGQKQNVQIVPTDDANALVAYLLSLRADAPVFEAPIPQPPKKEGQGDTNAAPANTNAQPAPAPAPGK